VSKTGKNEVFMRAIPISQYIFYSFWLHFTGQSNGGQPEVAPVGGIKNFKGVSHLFIS
jgi:hypothetical protein